MYKRLSFIEREEISRQLAYGNNIRNIANILKRTPSTVYREINSIVVDPKYYRSDWKPHFSEFHVSIHHDLLSGIFDDCHVSGCPSLHDDHFSHLWPCGE